MARVLVVDDTPSIRFLIRTNLELDGHDVIEADNGQDCLDTLSRESVDVLLIDVVMPELDGYASVATLRAQPEYADLPIIMVTTQSQVADIRRGTEVGVTEYVVKPFDPDALVELVADVLARGGR